VAEQARLFISLVIAPTEGERLCSGGAHDLLSPTNAGRAAQYVRMSTDHQHFSTQNQAAAIAVYAAQHDLTIVRTYTDEGRSGLRIELRELIELIDDVRSGRAEFDHILVYDVSRWGRFQDVDESAYCEFTCRQAGEFTCRQAGIAARSRNRDWIHSAMNGEGVKLTGTVSITARPAWRARRQTN
jgi:predicted site-specific integrase-resolvase